MKIKIIVATHKEKPSIKSDIFLPIQVGAKQNEFIIDNSYILDKSHDNISEKNYTFNELTGLYWAWKNMTDFDVFGLMHYRRYLDLHYRKGLFKKENNDILIPVKQNSKKLLKLLDSKKTEKVIKKLLKNHDMIVPKPAFCSINNESASIDKDYKNNHISEDWDICMQIIGEKFPAYRKSIDKYLENDNKFYIGNMFLSNKKTMNDYCNWLFTILFEVEKRITISEDLYQRRVIGFLSERLFTLYILHNNFRLKQVPILFIE
ncbi:DUF4422 domain-containing protein [Chryseobacterium oryctis]|uniref:DUF4422 domain-containing protein n=1 Tax=Chryseobacterium oryctis TaxID=2952618 RepID=A0ABT3HKN3_9FLAO|nr:DUF4422 domain-containing protein [Chryseobacterium oryctis]MCW3160316.1 DUF4422 domain-containing protein [Chryseobacterium oryctis]